MYVTVAVLVAAMAAAVIAGLLSRSPDVVDPIDPEAEERWLLRWLVAHPRFGSTARAVDRRVAGGLMLVVALAIVIVTALAVGLLFDMVDSASGIARWDQSVAEWGSSNSTAWSTRVLDIVTDFGASVVLLVIFVVVATLDYARHRNINVALFLAVVLVGVVVVNNVLKLIVDRDRPDVLRLVEASGSSFPSGHSASAAAGWFALALVISRHWPRVGRAVAAAIATAIVFGVAASRALLGVHWLTDVIAGVMVGWGWFMLSALAFGGRMQRLGEPAEH